MSKSNMFKPSNKSNNRFNFLADELKPEINAKKNVKVDIKVNNKENTFLTSTNSTSSSRFDMAKLTDESHLDTNIRDTNTRDNYSRDTNTKNSKNMLNNIKQKGPYLLTYTDSEITIPNKDGNCNPVLTEEQKDALYGILDATSNCKFKMGDFIIYKDIEYIVLDHRNDYESNCSSYIVCTSDGDPVVSIISNIVNIKSSQKQTMPIDALLKRVHSSGKYSEIVQAADKSGTLKNDITIPGAIVSSLTQLGGGKTRKHRRTRKTRKSRKTIKKRKITKKRKTIRK